MAEVYWANGSELATLTNTFKLDGIATDPDTVSLTVTDPTGAATTYTYAAHQIVRSSAGVYYYDVAVPIAGIWTYAWVGTGAVSDVVPGSWTVLDSSIYKRYATTEELKSRLGIDDEVDDFEIELVMDAVSRQIDSYCGRRFWRASETRTFTSLNPYSVDVDDLVSVSALTTDPGGDGTFEITWASSDYQLLPLNPTSGPETRPYTEIRAVGSNMFPYFYSPISRRDRVQIVGVFGWPEVPMAVKQAALILAADLLKLKDAPFGVAGFDGMGVVRVQDNRRALSLLNPYRNPRAWLA